MLVFLPQIFTKFLLYSVIGSIVSGSDSAFALLYFISANCKYTSPGFHLSLSSSPANSTPVVLTSSNVPAPVINGESLPYAFLIAIADDKGSLSVSKATLSLAAFSKFEVYLLRSVSTLSGLVFIPL